MQKRQMTEASNGVSMDAASHSIVELEKINQQLRTIIVPRKPIAENVFIDWVLQGTLSATQLSLSGQLPIDRPALISWITYVFSAANASNQIQIGDRVYPIGNNANQLVNSLDVQIVVYPKDVVTITSVATNVVFLNLQGHPLEGTEYSVLK